MITIPVDLPADFTSKISFAELEAKVADLSPVMHIIQETWDYQTVENLEKGLVVVPDHIINKSLTEAIGQHDQIKELTINSIGEGKLKITAITKDAGRVVLTCKIVQFQHTKHNSIMQLKVLDKKLPDKPMLSWIFSKVSLAMAAKFVGNIDMAAGITVDIKGNAATVNFHQALYNSRFGSAELFGYKPLDAIVINDALPQSGCIEFHTGLDMPENVKAMVRNLLE
ncbi:hypothetical protein [Dendrosporobacter sp. 1207_IL3150]|uniref:hypothetical protein n=1 Tax=Dendrosporobacter sp. 1207_IL3150 TaxID=3084054 RepID=UPI002FDAE7CA